MKPLDAAFDALASEHRREILAQLCRGPASISELRESFAFTKQAMTKHVAVLEEAGLVERTVRGRVHELRLVPEPLDRTRDWIDERTRAWRANFGRLHQLLVEEEP